MTSYARLNVFKNVDVVNGVTAKLRAAKAALLRNDVHAALGQLTAFCNQLRADDIVVSNVVRDQLLTDTQALITALK
jgi:hypothetical protein